MYQWFILLHVFFAMLWCSGLFYLPQLMVNMAMAVPGSLGYQRLLSMARTCLRATLPFGLLAISLGVFIACMAHWWGQAWVHTEVTLVVILFGYQGFCWKLLQDFHDARNRYSVRWYRVLNMIPMVVMAFALYLIIFRPF